MKKILLIIKREYLTRVRNRTFLLSTFLLPILGVAFFSGSVYFAVKGRSQVHLAVVNDPGFYRATLKTDSSRIVLDFNPSVDSSNYSQQGYDGILYLPSSINQQRYLLFTQKTLGMETANYLQQQLNQALEEHLLLQNGIQQSLLDSISEASGSSYGFSNIIRENDGASKEANAGLAYGIGLGSGLLIYITIFIFGTMVMRGVMEEKMNRIAEVIVSSVKPFQLMTGKIIGIAAVGLTQFLLWIALILVLFNASALFIPQEWIQQAQSVNTGMPGNNDAALKLLELKATLHDVNWPLILSCFLFYFLGGYLFYASLFAAVGSVINEDPQEAQSLILPISMPIVFAFIILSSGLQDTNSAALFWGSMIPFTSPIVMMGRIPNGVPWEQLAISMVLLIAGFLFTSWLAGKIYRTGILLYGKKVTWKEMLKWAFRKS